MTMSSNETRKHKWGMHKYKQMKVKNSVVENTHGLWDKLEKKTEFQQFIQSTNISFLSTYYVLGTIQVLEKKY